MPKIEIRQSLWDHLVAAAQRQKQKPEAVAQQALREYLERLSDEELLQQSAAAARRAPFRIEESEEIVRQRRKKAQSQGRR